jgi:hypothetical protein
MHPERSCLATLAALISIGLGSSGFAVAHGANGGNGSAGHGAGFHSSGSGHGHGHHRGGGHGEHGSGGGLYRFGEHGGWIIPGHGFYFASIPSYCKLVYWEGVPYYYADDLYYEWNGTAGAYQQVQPPAGLAEQIDAHAPAELFVFPNGDQTNEQVKRDSEACHDWAVQQAGFDPNAAPRTEASDRSAAKRANYLRADEACLEARDYTVE